MIYTSLCNVRLSNPIIVVRVWDRENIRDRIEPVDGNSRLPLLVIESQTVIQVHVLTIQKFHTITKMKDHDQ